MNEDIEYQALILRILGSKEFDRAPGRRDLLLFLFSNRDRLLAAKEIETEHFGKVANSYDFDPGHTRVLIGELKLALERYATHVRGERFRCEMQDAKKRGGYQLLFVPISPQLRPSGIFWNAQLERKDDLIVITGSHLFFYDPSRKYIFRFYDFNVDRDRSDLKRQLVSAHPELDISDVEPWPNTYMAAGDVLAYEALLCWFHQETGLILKRVVSRDITDNQFKHYSPILIGRGYTNRFIGGMLESPQASELAYRFVEKGILKIKDIRPGEREALASFSVSPDGMVGPIEEYGPALGIFTRLPNPSGFGYVTIISCDYYAMVNARMAEASTKDGEAAELLKQMNWPPNRDLPQLFEILFSVTLSPGGLEGEGYPKVLCWRTGEQTF